MWNACLQNEMKLLTNKLRFQLCFEGYRCHCIYHKGTQDGDTYN
jgi:hypothetical protein